MPAKGTTSKHISTLVRFAKRPTPPEAKRRRTVQTSEVFKTSEV